MPRGSQIGFAGYVAPCHSKGHRAGLLIERTCRENQISMESLQSGSRISEVSRLRSQLADTLFTGYGLSLAETARQLGVTTSSIANGMRRNKI